MPTNLNALIRYRTIDSCLSNPYRKWTIGDLAEACAGALKEHRGIYSGISERTIREDIRVMRSDILGFNAPIVQSSGHYSYEDRDYSIFNVTIKDSGLLSRVLDFILEIRSDINHPEMEQIIESITEAISESQHIEEPGTLFDEELRTDMDEDLGMPMKASKPGLSKSYKQPDRLPGKDLTWAGILNLIR
jgi:hypothetical protein